MGGVVTWMVEHLSSNPIESICYGFFSGMMIKDHRLDTSESIC